MSFTKQYISSKILCIVDIGSYKLRVCAAKFKNNKISILGYREKRQDISYFANQECLNLPGLCENISEIIEKLEKDIGGSLKNVVLNYPFWELFLSSRKINYKRKFPHTWITMNELEEILGSVEKLCLSRLTDEVDKLYGLTPEELQIILSRVNHVRIDGEKVEKVVGKQWENLKISLLNAFIPASKNTLLSQIGNATGRKIFRILPVEYCLTKIFHQKNAVIINIWATQTTISVKKEWDVVWISKIPMGINDLVNKISRNHDITRAKIIDSLWDSDLYEEEKDDFLRVWGEAVGLTLGEILVDSVCPKYFYVWGGWANNIFLRNYLMSFPFWKYNIKMVNSITFISEDMTKILWEMQHIRLNDIQRIPLEIYVLLLETNNLISHERDALSTSLKQAIKKLWYINS